MATLSRPTSVGLSSLPPPPAAMFSFETSQDMLAAVEPVAYMEFAPPDAPLGDGKEGDGLYGSL